MEEILYSRQAKQSIDYSKAASNTDALKTVKIRYQAELIDKYRNSLGYKDVFAIAFDVTEAMKFNFDNATSADMADLAIVEVVHPAAADKIMLFCNGNMGKYSPAFCRRKGGSPVTRQ
jgi:hypothetical protein